MATIVDLKLDPASGDLVIENGDLVLIEDADVVAQQLRLRLRTILGEWYLDTTSGVDYFGRILGKGRQRSLVESTLRDAIVGVPFVTELLSFDAQTDPVTRGFRLQFAVLTQFGEVTIEAGTPA